MKKKILFIIIVAILVGIGLYVFKNSSTKTSSNKSLDYEYDEKMEYDENDATKISLNSDSIKVEGEGAAVKNNQVSITDSGIYFVSGTTLDGNIIVDASKNDIVIIVLNNATIKSSDNSPIYVKKSGKTIINLNKETKNYLEDSSKYSLDTDDEGVNATIYSKSDLVINGYGSLTIKANYNNGINSKDSLKLIGGTIDITSINHGIKGKDYIYVKDSNININASGDGIKAYNETDNNLGYIKIENGTFNITATQDGIQAINDIKINDGEFTITTNSGSSNVSTSNGWGDFKNPMNNNSNDDENSAKGIKTNGNLIINNGTFTIDSADDCIHTNNTITINNGTFKLNSGDDGIHADSSITINNGTINIEKSYEGIESAVIEINDGNINITANDDGINVAGGNDSSSMGGRPGENNINTDNGQMLTINNGYIYVNAVGDGLDANGSISINGGTVIVDGPTDNGNAALDFDGELIIKDGLVIAAGSSGMLEMPSNESQNTISITFDSTMSANTIVNITDSNGNEIITYKPSKSFQNIIISSSKITNGTYNINYGGNYSTSDKNGLYQDGTYSGGTLYKSVTVSSSITTIGTSEGGMNNPMGGQNPGQRQDQMMRR